MIDIKIQWQRDWKANFFDSKKIMRSVGRATRKILSKMGAYIRTRARSSIKSRKGVSAAGHPPFSHKSQKIKAFDKWLIARGREPEGKSSQPEGIRQILFAYTEKAGAASVVIGAMGRPGRAPELLEYGGTAKRTPPPPDGGPRITVRARYRPRPFMGPAMLKEQQRFVQMWRDAL